MKFGGFEKIVNSAATFDAFEQGKNGCSVWIVAK